MRPITMFKIEKLAEGETILLKLVGRICATQLHELSRLIEETQASVKLDLSEVTLVDLEAIRFLGSQEQRGAELANCSRYVREWIQRERTPHTAQTLRGDFLNITQEDEVPTIQIVVERFGVTSEKSFADVISAIDSQVGHPNIIQFYSSVQNVKDDDALQQLVHAAVGPSDLMEFMRLDHGAIVGSEPGAVTNRVLRLLIGNPLIMRRMVKHVPDAGSYAPVTILVDERVDGVHLSYDRMSSLIVGYGNAEALEVARSLDSKVEALLIAAAH